MARHKHVSRGQLARQYRRMLRSLDRERNRLERGQTWRNNRETLAVLGYDMSALRSELERVEG